MTGIGTIDRLKKKMNQTFSDCDDEPIPLKDIFGIAPLYMWPFPVDPVFDDHDRVMGYSTTHRLLRERALSGGAMRVGGAVSDVGSQNFSDV